jgi:hypothetical protein
MLAKRFLLIALSVVLILVFVGYACSCTGESRLASSDNLSDAVITFERTICYGKCPAYRLTILGSGAVTYEGKKFVKIVGKAEGAISQEQVKQLVSEFDKANFYSLHDNYVEITATDLPYVTTSIILTGKMKSIKHYLGDASAPKKLTTLETRIDEIVNSDQWIK